MDAGPEPSQDAGPGDLVFVVAHFDIFLIHRFDDVSFETPFADA